MNPIPLNLSEILRIHDDQIRRYGGSTGVRDLGLLESAVEMPMAWFENRFLHNDIFEMAAAYLFHIVMNHPFVDGNKRTGAVASDVFLYINGWNFMADEERFETLVLSVAQGNTNKTQVAQFLRSHSVATTPQKR